MTKPTQPLTLAVIVKQALADLQPVFDELAETKYIWQLDTPVFLKFIYWYGTLHRDSAPFLKSIRLPRRPTPRPSLPDTERGAIAQPFIMKPVLLTPSLNDAWEQYRQQHSEASFGPFVRSLLEEALCVTGDSKPSRSGSA